MIHAHSELTSDPGPDGSIAARARAGCARAVLWAVAALGAFGAESVAADPSVALAERLGVARGLAVVLDDDPSCAAAIGLARASELTVYVQMSDARALEPARRAVEQAGLYGRRVYVEGGAWDRIHLADNLAGALVAVGSVQVAPDEALRVLHPGGKALLGGRELLKPLPAGAGDWTHPYHGPDNNPQSTDRLARAPYLTHFLAQPWYVPQPQVTVAAGGRLFQALGHITSKPREWPWINTLIAVNGYNGTILWRRELSEGFMIHRNTMIATAEELYLGDDASCKVLDAATGALRREIAPPPDQAGGTVWKWMAMEDGVLYALLGGPEQSDKPLRNSGLGHGWGWGGLGRGYAMQPYPWGFGHDLLAIDPLSGRVLWHYRAEQPIDGRAVCMRAGRLYFYCPGTGLSCLDARTGRRVWTNADADLLAAIGPDSPAQRATYGYTSSAYIKAGEGVLLLAGPTRPKLVAAAEEDGRLLWSRPDGNVQLVLRDEGLYALGRTATNTLLLEPRTGKVLREWAFKRANCTRATASADSIFVRGSGTTRLDLKAGQPTGVAPMRPPCQDGVLTANGLLYWGPWMCDCQLSLIGSICLSPAGAYDFAAAAGAEPVLETPAPDTAPLPRPTSRDEPTAAWENPRDWPTYRKDNVRSGGTPVSVPEKASLQWTYTPPAPGEATAPTAAGGMIFVGGADGIVRALDGRTGEPRWRAFTAGPVVFPPTLADGVAYVGSGDGWIYALDAGTGAVGWRFRAAPLERKIPVYGTLTSTWPVNSGVLVADGTAYAAAGIANYDGTHVYALDARTGAVRWRNHGSGELTPGLGVGVSVQGCLLLHDGKLHLAGGNAVSPAQYDLRDGACLNTVESFRQTAGAYEALYRGRDLYLVDGKVIPSNHVLYSPPADHDRPVNWTREVLQSFGGRWTVSMANGPGRKIIGSARPAGDEPPQAVWEASVLAKPVGIAVTANATVVIGVQDPAKPSFAVVALSIENGMELWRHELPAAPVRWGLAIDRDAQVIVTLRDGRVMCFGE